MQVEGIPDGLEVIAYREARYEEAYLDVHGRVCRWTLHGESDGKYLIVQKTEKPKLYRPFANAEEFKPHRDRWVRFSQSGVLYRITEYSDTGIAIGSEAPWDYDAAFASLVFDDGSPFGVEVA